MRINAMTQNKKLLSQRLTLAVTTLCLPLLLTSCKNLNALPASPVVLSPQIDPELLAPTPVPVMPAPFLWRSALLWNADLLTALGQCNRDKTAARQQNEQRKRIYGRPDPGAGQPAP
ncbi:Rz1-like lysis system protein LysC [Tenebrionicola larvae]